jgi:hypothetical protein
MVAFGEGIISQKYILHLSYINKCIEKWLIIKYYLINGAPVYTNVSQAFRRINRVVFQVDGDNVEDLPGEF